MVAVVKMHQIFSKYFNFAHHGKVPCHNTVQLWTENFRTNPSAFKKKLPCSVCTVPLPVNIEAVLQSFIRSLRCSARRHSVAPGISDRNMRILHKDLSFHLYKMVLVQELRDHDMASRSMVAPVFNWTFVDGVVILMAGETYFHLSGCVNSFFLLLGGGKSTLAP
jgi:hypothetical protein